MGLRTVSCSKCLDKRLQFGGFEVGDIIILLFVLTSLNFLFGQTPLKIPFVWVPTAALAIMLRFGKHGKPDRFLKHFLLSQLSPKHLSAFLSPGNDLEP